MLMTHLRKSVFVWLKHVNEELQSQEGNLILMSI
jgi:hypothetical protein